MRRRSTSFSAVLLPGFAAVILIGLALVNCSAAQLISRDEWQRQNDELEKLKAALSSDTTDAARFVRIEQVMKVEQDVDFRHRIVATATKFPGPEFDAFLTKLLTNDADAGVRSLAAKTLGQLGSEKCLAALAEAAQNDSTTTMQTGCLVGNSSARRAATFAIAELAERCPLLKSETIAKLRALHPPAEDKRNEHLEDARLQALYQITRDEALLKSFYDRLNSADANERQRGVVAFRFLKLKTAPAGVVGALKDTDTDVRSWAALVLGEIGDSKTAPALMVAAENSRELTQVRCNAISALGHMKSAEAATSVEKLLADADATVQTNAAIALYRITGRKVQQFPEGYSTE